MRDLTHAGDLGELFARLLQTPVTGALNLGSGERVSLAQVARTIATECGQETLLQLQETPDTDAHPELLVPDLERLRNQLDWAPRFDLAKGVADVVAAARKEMAEGSRG